MTHGATAGAFSRTASLPPPLAHRRWLGRGLLTLLAGYVGNPVVFGSEHIPHTPYLVCANHRSHVDSLALIQGLDLTNRCALLAARDYFVVGRPWQRLLATPFTVIAVERHRPGVSMLATIREARTFFRSGGQALITFPEGSRQPDGEPASFKRGVAMLALALGRPILPVFIDGTERVLAKGSRLPVPGRISLFVAPPIDPGPRPSGTEWRMRSQRLISLVEASVRGMALDRLATAHKT